MSKSIKQLRFYSPKGNGIAYTNVSGAQLITGINKIDGMSNLSIYLLGIQSLPGTSFTLGSSNNNSPIIIGLTGIFEMDFSNFANKPNNLQILPSSIKNIINNSIGYIIIDLVYEGGADS